MKGQRSHRPSNTEPDDWGDGSWTVDCSCGVNYDDGEEMVNCDECGVWVHTKCSSFVKGETSFACDKCKLIKKRRNQETEETEVAQLLAELPTKTMRMDSSPAIPPPPLRPDLPMDDRVHVQGLPTGDSISFQGLGVFSPQLWKCTGYVPKSLNFQYREFPCWDEEKENVDAQVDRPGVEVGAGLKPGIVEEPGSRDKSHHRHEQGMKGEKHQHHHGHHHRQGKRRKDDREHGGKKRVKPSGEKDKDEKLKRKSSSQDAGHGSRALLRSLPNNPKAMRNLAAQKFLDDIKLRSNVEMHELPCHEYVCGGTHEKFEGPDCEIEEAVDKCTSFDNRVIKSEESRETEIPDIEVDGAFKKNEAKKNIEKSKSISAVRTHSTEMLGDSFICTVLSESQMKIDKKDCSSTGKVAKLSPWRESTNAQPEASEFAGVIVKQESQDVKTAVEDVLTYNAEKCNIDLRNVTHPAINAEQAIDVEFASSKPISENYLQVDTLPNHMVTCPSLNGSAASAFSTRLVKVQCEVKDESSMLDAKASSCSNAHSSRDKLLGKSSKFHIHNSDEPISCSQSKQLAASGTSVIKEATQFSGLVGRSPRPDDGLQSYKQLPLGQKQIEDLFQASKDAEDLIGKSGQSKENTGDTDIKSGPDSAKQVVAEAVNYSDDSVSEERQCKLEQSCQGFPEQARVSPQQSSVLQQETRPPLTHRPRFTMGSSIYSASAIALSMQVPSARSVAGSSKSSPVAAHLHKNTVSGVGKTFNSSSVSRSAMSGPISVANSKSSGQVIKSSVNPVSSSSATKPAHPSKQRFRSGSPADFKKDEAGNAFGKFSNSGSPSRVPPDASSFKPVKENIKCSTNSTVKAASHGKSSIQAGASKHVVSNSKGHKSIPSSKSSSGQTVPRCSSSTEQASAMQPQNHSSMQAKQVTFGESHKNEKLNSQASQSVSKANAALPHAHPQVPNSVSATLSDEELALLLHQELNSSPRVPRVPRVRHTGNIPQLASPTPLSGTFVKRPTAVTPQGSSVSGQKDHTLVSRRRGREDNAREGSRTPVQGLDESIKAEGLLSSPDTRRLEESNRGDDFSYPGRREVHSKTSDNTYAAKKILSLTNVNNMTDGSSHSLAFDSNDGPSSSVHVSPGDLSDDAETMITEGIALTLPGLIDDILSKAPKMSYEEICEAVLPHWQKLRKHNGERYAYTSHYQAVLDCLRNRTAWAHLVDRGPKTGMGRKRRRIDLAAAADSENEEDAEGRHSVHEDDEHTGRSSKLHDVGSERTDSLASDRQKDIDTTPLEEVPKGKRKARRRRSVAFKGKEDINEFKRSNKEDKQRYKIEGSIRITQEDEHEPFSPSSEDAESIDSEDDNHHAGRNVRMHLASSDTSADDLESTPLNLA